MTGERKHRGTAVERWRRLAALTALVTAAGAAFSGLPASAADDSLPDTSYATSGTTADEQLRSDQCRMDIALRIGGPKEKEVAAQALDGTPAQLRAVAKLGSGADDESALSKAWDADFKAGFNAGMSDKLSGRRKVWQEYVPSDTPPPGYTNAKWSWAPDFFNTVGLSDWVYNSFARSASDLYGPTIRPASQQDQDAAIALGKKLYTEGHGDTAEQNAWGSWVFAPKDFPLAADDVRLFLQDGGFARSAPKPDTLEFRLAVEALKARFASCDWRNPPDPNGVLGQETSTAAAEWQHEISSQQPQRDTILATNRDATRVLAKAAGDLGELLGRSWQAGRLTTWLHYWQGPGTLGTAPITFHLSEAHGMCLDDPGSSKKRGTRVWLYTCNKSVAQQWTYDQDTGALKNKGGKLCLDVDGTRGTPKPGSRVQLWSCNGTGNQRWYLAKGGTVLHNVGTGLCLDTHTAKKRQYSQVWSCNGTKAQGWDASEDNTGTGAGTDSMFYPSKKSRDAVSSHLTSIRRTAKSRLDDLAAQLKTAEADAGKVKDAERAAYKTADAEGAPRGRGLLGAQQAAQVALATSAAVQAVDKAGATAYHAVTAAADQGRTLRDLAVSQAHQTRAEFRAAAAKEADAQAEAAAEGAAAQARTAAAADTTAHTELAAATKAQAVAKAAAATAHAKRLAAEKNEKTAEAEKETAAAEQARAAADRATAQTDAASASRAEQKAESAAATAAAKRQAAEDADTKAAQARGNAWAAARRADAAQAKAAAKDAYADAHASASDAKASRAAANEADQAANEAEADAKAAHAAADDATSAATAADAAATRAEAAAERARADAGAAQAAKDTADAAVKEDTKAAAEAILASRTAARAARTASGLADEAEKHAKDARAQADGAAEEAGSAVAAAAEAAGYASTTASAAEAARDSASQVAEPANDAVQLGSPYSDTDPAAGLAVLTGQASKTIGQQQAAVAQARADQAKTEAGQAKAAADAATGDAKAAYESAASAAGHAADARASARDAMASAADAAQAAADAAATVPPTLAYDKAAGADASAAAKAADTAQGYADRARGSADQAALDADAARAAAARAEQAAEHARAAAKRADADATAAEAAAKDARKQAEDAQKAAVQAEKQADRKNVASRIAANGGLYTKYTITSESADPNGDCVGTGTGSHIGCDISMTFHISGTVQYWLLSQCTVTSSDGDSCTGHYIYLDSKPFHVDYTKTVHINGLKLTESVVKGLLKGITQDFVDCSHGSVGGCAWAASVLIPPDRILQASKLVAAVEEALRTGSGIDRAVDAIKSSVAAGKVNEALSTTVIARLEEETGIAAAGGSVAERLSHLVHAFQLGWDVRKEKFLADEAHTGLLFEEQTGTDLIRYEPPAPVPGEVDPPSPDWVDASGRTYDAMGRNLTPSLFKMMWAKTGKRGLRTTIAKHVGKADVTVFDVTNIGADDIATLKTYLTDNDLLQKVTLVGEHS
ncbi:ricin-type beta-trefoil lectin domain protein [Streptomyces sp. MS06]|uniref:ricin-type beta-trefoil lectin domain protein n=1 Tax=Streptomyces sp. MS06 TaxID=3385974 RepID=UPI0039A0AE3C